MLLILNDYADLLGVNSLTLTRFFVAWQNRFDSMAPQTILNTFGIYEFLPNFLEVKSWLAHTICGLSPAYEGYCRDFFSVFVGNRPEHLNASMAATYMSQMPAGGSTKTFVHFAQVIFYYHS